MDGCDSLQCEQCRQTINVLGRSTREHLFYRQDFLKAAQTYGPTMAKDQLAALSGQHPAAWAGLYLQELIDFLESADPGARANIINEMWEATWDGFKYFLMQHYAPDQVPEERKTAAPRVNPESSLRALLASLPAESNDHRAITTFLAGPTPPEEFQRNRLRSQLAGNLEDYDRRELLKRNLRNDAWWR